MGYDLHITRAEHWAESEAHPIALAEWLDFVAGDPEMRRDDVAVARVDGKAILRYENEGLAVWVRYSGHNDEGEMAWFDYREGRVVVKDPDCEVIAKMTQVAEQLRARVVGDEGEEY